jgi:hypothetical protein
MIYYLSMNREVGLVGHGPLGRPRPRSADGNFYVRNAFQRQRVRSLAGKVPQKASVRWTRPGPAQRAVPHQAAMTMISAGSLLRRES